MFRKAKAEISKEGLNEYQKLLMEINEYYGNDPNKPTMAVKVTPRKAFLLRRCVDVANGHYLSLKCLEENLLGTIWINGAKIVRAENTGGQEC